MHEDCMTVCTAKSSFHGRSVQPGYLFGVDSVGPWIYEGTSKPKDAFWIAIQRLRGRWWVKEFINAKHNTARLILKHFADAEQRQSVARPQTQQVSLGVNYLNQPMTINPVINRDRRPLMIPKDIPGKKCIFSGCKESTFGNSDFCWEHFKQEKYTLR